LVKWVATEVLPDGRRTERFEFLHAVCRQVVYDRLTPGRRAALHKVVGERLLALFSARLDDVAMELAMHFWGAGDVVQAVEFLKLAASKAGRRRAHRLATSMLSHALELTERLPEARREKLETEILAALADHRMASDTALTI